MNVAKNPAGRLRADALTSLVRSGERRLGRTNGGGHGHPELARKAGVRWPPVLMYHAVTRVPDDPNGICVSPERFEAQMLHLRRRRLRGVSMNELVRAVRRGEAGGLVGLTFDDGYEDLLHNALPVLERLGFTATAFVLAELLGRENSWDRGYRLKLLGVEGLREVEERGVEVGSHGMTHVELPNLTPERLEHEVRASRHLLSEVLGHAVEGFCYPYGGLDGSVVEAVRRAGYGYACAYKGRDLGGPYSIPRTYVGERDKAVKLALKLRANAYYHMVARGFG